MAQKNIDKRVQEDAHLSRTSCSIRDPGAKHLAGQHKHAGVGDEKEGEEGNELLASHL